MCSKHGFLISGCNIVLTNRADLGPAHFSAWIFALARAEIFCSGFMAWLVCNVTGTHTFVICCPAENRDAAAPGREPSIFVTMKNIEQVSSDYGKYKRKTVILKHVIATSNLVWKVQGNL